MNPKTLKTLQPVWTLLIVLGTLAGLYAAHRRWQVEANNRRIEIAVEWPEISLLAQNSGRNASALLSDFRAQGVTGLVLAEDTLIGMEQIGAARPIRIAGQNGTMGATVVTVNTPELLKRIASGLAIRGFRADRNATEASLAATGGTLFTVAPESPSSSTPAHPSAADTPTMQTGLAVPVDYANLRTLGLGLPPDAIRAARATGLAIVGRIGNFLTVTPTRAALALNALRAQGAKIVIFNGDDVLGFKDMERDTSLLLRDPDAPHATQAGETLPPASGLVYGAVEFSKQHGDEKLSAMLHGDYVRVHAIQAAELANMDENEVEERFVKAVRERNMRLCYVRLLTQGGEDPVGQNVEFLKKLNRSMARGAFATGGGFAFGPAERFGETGVARPVFALVALGVAGGTAWMVAALLPLPNRWPRGILLLLLLFCVGLALAGETGRRLAALLAGISFPALACLLTFPRVQERMAGEAGSPMDARPLSKFACVREGARRLAIASGVTAIGIIHVVGLLATRPFMLRANQFLGIKAQHAIPVVIIAAAALVGGVARSGEGWRAFRNRIESRIQSILDSPLQLRLVLVGGIALFALMLIVARTGNDAGVGVSGFELKARSILDRFLVERPRTKEFLIGHPAFVLGIAWWLRGRRKLALPAFVVGSIGQVSILNTFCHIHTPLPVSIWRDVIGLVIGAVIGVLAFYLAELVLPRPAEEDETRSQTPE